MKRKRLSAVEDDQAERPTTENVAWRLITMSEELTNMAERLLADVAADDPEAQRG